jgi:hypothetical protein
MDRSGSCALGCESSEKGVCTYGATGVCKAEPLTGLNKKTFLIIEVLLE